MLSSFLLASARIAADRKPWPAQDNIVVCNCRSTHLPLCRRHRQSRVGGLRAVLFDSMSVGYSRLRSLPRTVGNR